MLDFFSKVTGSIVQSSSSGTGNSRGKRDNCATTYTRAALQEIRSTELQADAGSLSPVELSPERYNNKSIGVTESSNSRSTIRPAGAQADLHVCRPPATRDPPRCTLENAGSVSARQQEQESAAVECIDLCDIRAANSSVHDSEDISFTVRSDTEERTRSHLVKHDSAAANSSQSISNCLLEEKGDEEGLGMDATNATAATAQRQLLTQRELDERSGDATESNHNGRAIRASSRHRPPSPSPSSSLSNRSVPLSKRIAGHDVRVYASRYEPVPRSRRVGSSRSNKSGVAERSASNQSEYHTHNIVKHTPALMGAGTCDSSTTSSSVIVFTENTDSIHDKEYDARKEENGRQATEEADASLDGAGCDDAHSKSALLFVRESVAETNDNNHPCNHTCNNDRHRYCGRFSDSHADRLFPEHLSSSTARRSSSAMRGDELRRDNNNNRDNIRHDYVVVTHPNRHYRDSSNTHGTHTTLRGKIRSFGSHNSDRSSAPHEAQHSPPAQARSAHFFRTASASPSSRSRSSRQYSGRADDMSVHRNTTSMRKWDALRDEPCCASASASARRSYESVAPSMQSTRNTHRNYNSHNIRHTRNGSLSRHRQRHNVIEDDAASSVAYAEENLPGVNDEQLTRKIRDLVAEVTASERKKYGAAWPVRKAPTSWRATRKSPSAHRLIDPVMHSDDTGSGMNRCAKGTTHRPRPARTSAAAAALSSSSVLSASFANSAQSSSCAPLSVRSASSLHAHSSPMCRSHTRNTFAMAQSNKSRVLHSDDEGRMPAARRHTSHRHMQSTLTGASHANDNDIDGSAYLGDYDDQKSNRRYSPVKHTRRAEHICTPKNYHLLHERSVGDKNKSTDERKQAVRSTHLVRGHRRTGRTDSTIGSDYATDDSARGERNNISVSGRRAHNDPTAHPRYTSPPSSRLRQAEYKQRSTAHGEVELSDASYNKSLPTQTHKKLTYPSSHSIYDSPLHPRDIDDNSARCYGTSHVARARRGRGHTPPGIRHVNNEHMDTNSPHNMHTNSSYNSQRSSTMRRRDESDTAPSYISDNKDSFSDEGKNAIETACPEDDLDEDASLSMHKLLNEAELAEDVTTYLTQLRERVCARMTRLRAYIDDHDSALEAAMMSSPWSRLYHLGNAQDRRKRATRLGCYCALRRLRERLDNGTFTRALQRRRALRESHQRAMTDPEGVFVRLYEAHANRLRIESSDKRTLPHQMSTDEKDTSHMSHEQSSSAKGIRKKNTTKADERCAQLYLSGMASHSRQEEARQHAAHAKEQQEVEELLIARLACKLERRAREKQAARHTAHPPIRAQRKISGTDDNSTMHTHQNINNPASNQARSGIRASVAHSVGSSEEGGGGTAGLLVDGEMYMDHPDNIHDCQNWLARARELYRQRISTNATPTQSDVSHLLHGPVCSAEEQARIVARLHARSTYSVDALRAERARVDQVKCTFHPQTNTSHRDGNAAGSRSITRSRLRRAQHGNVTNWSASAEHSDSSRVNNNSKQLDRCTRLYNVARHDAARRAKFHAAKMQEKRLAILRSRLENDHHFRKRVELDPALAKRFMKSLAV